MNQKHIKNKKNLRIIGFIFLPLGLACIIGGVLGCVVGGIWGLMFLSFPGVIFIGIGGTCLMLTYQASVMRFTKNETVPIFNEMSGQMAPGISNMTSAVKAGLEGKITCTCGTVNDETDNFCKNCGLPLKKVCPICGKKLEANSKFCPECGVKVE